MEELGNGVTQAFADLGSEINKVVINPNQWIREFDSEPSQRLGLVALLTAESGIIRPGGAGLGSTGGKVFGLPKPMPVYTSIMGVSTEEAIIVQVPASNVTQNGLGHLLHKGPVLLQ
jgi:hypothetical protein